MKTIGKGGIFAAYKTFPYYPQGSLFGQLNDESWAAAVCRMILHVDGIEIPEAYLRSRLETRNKVTPSSRRLSRVRPAL